MNNRVFKITVPHLGPEFVAYYTDNDSKNGNRARYKASSLLKELGYDCDYERVYATRAKHYDCVWNHCLEDGKDKAFMDRAYAAKCLEESKNKKVKTPWS